MAELLDPITPGEILKEEFLDPMGISQYRLAKEIGVPAQRIGRIVLGRRAITADTDLRLCRFFGLMEGYWLHAQVAYDLELARRKIARELDAIAPWREAALAQEACAGAKMHSGKRGRILPGLSTGRRAAVKRLATGCGRIVRVLQKRRTGAAARR